MIEKEGVIGIHLSYQRCAVAIPGERGVHPYFFDVSERINFIDQHRFTQQFRAIVQGVAEKSAELAVSPPQRCVLALPDDLSLEQRFQIGSWIEQTGIHVSRCLGAVSTAALYWASHLGESGCETVLVLDVRPEAAWLGIFAVKDALCDVLCLRTIHTGEDPAILFKLECREGDSLEDVLLRQERSSIPPIDRIIYIGQNPPSQEEHQTLQPVFDLLGVDASVPVECNPLFPVLGTLVEAAILRMQGGRVLLLDSTFLGFGLLTAGSRLVRFCWRCDTVHGRRVRKCPTCKESTDVQSVVRIARRAAENRHPYLLIGLDRSIPVRRREKCLLEFRTSRLKLVVVDQNRKVLSVNRVDLPQSRKKPWFGLIELTVDIDCSHVPIMTLKRLATGEKWIGPFLRNYFAESTPVPTDTPGPPCTARSRSPLTQEEIDALCDELILSLEDQQATQAIPAILEAEELDALLVGLEAGGSDTDGSSGLKRLPISAGMGLQSRP
ncbi:MAG: hypothetical protein HQL80_03980 [Magnetococcales bacterium]|nr:hypothetical protein [Magnetococcales bacterium]